MGGPVEAKLGDEEVTAEDDAGEAPLEGIHAERVVVAHCREGQRPTTPTAIQGLCCGRGGASCKETTTSSHYISRSHKHVVGNRFE